MPTRINSTQVVLRRVDRGSARAPMFELLVTDLVSSQLVVTVTLAPDQVAELVSSRAAVGDGLALTEHAHRFGKHLEVHEVRVPDDSNGSQNTAEAWADQYRTWHNWETVTVVQHPSDAGFTAVFRRWVDKSS